MCTSFLVRKPNGERHPLKDLSFAGVIRKMDLNPLNAELNPICHLLALLDHYILHVSRIRVNEKVWKGKIFIHLAQNWDKWWALVKKVMKILTSEKGLCCTESDHH